MEKENKHTRDNGQHLVSNPNNLFEPAYNVHVCRFRLRFNKLKYAHYCNMIKQVNSLLEACHGIPDDSSL